MQLALIARQTFAGEKISLRKRAWPQILGSRLWTTGSNRIQTTIWPNGMQTTWTTSNASTRPIGVNGEFFRPAVEWLCSSVFSKNLPPGRSSCKRAFLWTALGVAVLSLLSQVSDNSVSSSGDEEPGCLHIFMKTFRSGVDKSLWKWRKKVEERTRRVQNFLLRF